GSFAGGKPNELYVGGPRSGLNRCRVDADRVVPIQVVDWTAEEDATFSSAGTGRVAFVQGDAIVRLAGDTREAFKLPDGWSAPVHLVAGSAADSMWITQREQLAVVALERGAARVT